MRAALLLVMVAMGTAVAGPKATITTRMDCANVGNDAKIEKCVLCTSDFGTFKTANATCTYPTVKPGGKLKLDRADCFGGMTHKDVQDCDRCISEGGVFSFAKGDNLCSSRSVSENTPPITDAAGCKNTDLVHPLRAKACTACVKTGIAEFVPAGDNAGRCLNDALKFAAKFKLPEQSESIGYYASCPGGDDVKLSITCNACLRKQEVFLGGKCVKPAQAAKLAAKLPHVDLPPADVVVANGDMEVTETSNKDKKLVAQTWVPMTWLANGEIVFGQEAAHGGKIGVKLANKASVRTYRRAVPDTRYRLTYWVKASSAEPAGTLSAMIAVGGNSYNAKAKPTAEWTEQTYDFTSPKSNAATIPLILTFASNPKQNGADVAFLIDDVKLVKAPADAGQTTTTAGAPPAPASGSGSAMP